MDQFWSKSRSLKQLVLLSWIAPAALTFIASLTVFLFLGWLDYQNCIEITTADLKEKSKVAARTISAEILLQEYGAVKSVVSKLKNELNFGDIEVSQLASCTIERDVCVTVLDGSLVMTRQIPQISSNQYVVLKKSIPPLWSFMNVKFVVWSTIPVFFLIVAGLIIQLVFLRHKVIEPVSALVGVADSNFMVKDVWPIEVRHIGEELKASFDAKEQAVFAMLAKGVIHDIKTFMHSLLIATDMVSEVNDDAKRLRRLENLYSASKSNLPKIKRIIELTLDGSRDIQINETEFNLMETVKGAVEANTAYAKERRVVLSVIEPVNVVAAHDPVQLERALVNLIKNGIEVFPSGDSNLTTLREVRISLSEIDDVVQIAVDDSGPGYLGEVNSFMPTKSKKAHGAGLGLYITQKIIHGHQGKIEVMKSTLLGGARFCINLPKGGLS